MNTHNFPHYGSPCGWQMPCWCPKCQKRKAPEPPIAPIPARIARGVIPACPPVAVIPTIEIPTADGLKTLYNCFAHVDSTNTTYYIDDKHMIIVIWAGPVEVDDYDYQTNPLGLRSQEVWDFKNNRVIRYNKTGGYRLGTMTEA